MDKLIKKVVDFLEEARIKYDIPLEELEKGGQITYANGNDGTDFDWEANDRLCEFGYGVKSGDVWAFKLLLDRWGYAEIYCYPHGEAQSVEKLEKQLMTEEEAEDLKYLMKRHADNKGRYDCTLEELGVI